MKKLLLILTLCVLTLGLAGGALAQDAASESPFIAMLRAVPREFADGESLISYADTKALVQSWPGTFWPQDLAELWAAKDAIDPRYDVTWTALLELRVGMKDVLLAALYGGMPEAVGFDFSRSTAGSNSASGND